jgi:hypothetical protein
MHVPTTIVPTYFGNSLGKVEKVAEVRKAVPTPSVTLSNEHTSTKTHLEEIKFTNLKTKVEKIISNHIECLDLCCSFTII